MKSVVVAIFLDTSPIVINVPARGLLAVQIGWLLLFSGR